MIGIGRFLGQAASFSVAGVAVLGVGALIATDLLGAERISAALEWLTRPRSTIELGELERAKDFSFFTSEVVPETGWEVTTGVKFANYHALLERQESERWCYVIVADAGRLPRQITPGNQKAGEPPIFPDFTHLAAAEMSAVGVDAAMLSRIAHKHCRFPGAGKKTGDQKPDRRGDERLALLQEQGQ